MKKLCLLLCFAVLILLCGCKSETTASAADTGSEADEVSVYMPEDTSEVTVEHIPEKVSDGLYYANTNSKKFHYDTCPSARIIKNENLYITDNREELINGGYIPCKNCNP